MNPRTSVKLDASGYFVMCAVTLFNIFNANPDPVVKAWGWPLFLGCVAFGLLTFKRFTHNGAF